MAVLGYSQSATVATVEVNNLLNNPPAGLNPSDLPNLHVVLLGDPNNPIGGILARFQFPDGVQAFSLDSAPQHLPFLNVPLSLDPTPTTPFPTDIYTAEYDGYASFPEDPSNILADINALVGIETVHPTYPDLTPGVNSDIIDLGSIGDTTFHEIPAPLPLLAFMDDGGPAGQFFHVLLRPVVGIEHRLVLRQPGRPRRGVHCRRGRADRCCRPWAVTATGQLADISGDSEHPEPQPRRHLRRRATDLLAAADRPRRARFRRLQLLRSLSRGNRRRPGVVSPGVGSAPWTCAWLTTLWPPRG